jgi:acyl-coenzyme A thioesterase PaaI-like protein
MSNANASPGGKILESWRRLSSLPGGRWLFSVMIGRTAPYTGTVGGRFEEVRPGYARVTLRDRHRLRNHLASVHAVALVNLAEMTSGVAMMTALPPGVRGIVTALGMTYHKKARGRLVAECTATPPASISARTSYDVRAEIRDAAGDVVAVGTVTWLLDPPREVTAVRAAADGATETASGGAQRA